MPPGHKTGFGRSEGQPKRRVALADLIGAGILNPGTVLYARPKTLNGRAAIVLPDGRIDIDGSLFDSPSGAARSLSNRNANGWWFFNVGQKDGAPLAELLQEYVDQTSDDIDDESADQEIDDDEDSVEQLHGAD